MMGNFKVGDRVLCCKASFIGDNLIVQLGAVGEIIEIRKHTSKPYMVKFYNAKSTMPVSMSEDEIKLQQFTGIFIVTPCTNETCCDGYDSVHRYEQCLRCGGTSLIVCSMKMEYVAPFDPIEFPIMNLVMPGHENN